MINGIGNLGKWFITLALYLEFVFPLAFSSFDLLLLTFGLLAFVIVQVSHDSNKVIVVDRVWLFVVLLVSVNSIFVCLGALKGASKEGVTEAIRVYTLYPIVWIGLMVLLSRLFDIQSLSRLLIAVSISISILTLVQSAKVTSGIEVPGYDLLRIIYSDFDAGYTSFLFTGDQTSGYLPRSTERLAFLSGFSVALVSYSKWFKVNNKIIYINAMLVVMAVIVTERRIFIVITMLVLGLGLLRWLVVNSRHITPEKWLGRLISGMLLVGAVIYVGAEDAFISIEKLISHITRSVNEGGYSIRTEQMMVLLEGFSDNLVFGAGFGNDIDGYFRDIHAPWRFEMTYNALLYQTGILGFCLYTLLAGQLLIVIFNAIKSCGEIVMPYVISLGCALIAISTNPYLNYGSGQWLIFMPLIAFNILLADVADKQSTRKNIRGEPV